MLSFHISSLLSPPCSCLAYQRIFRSFNVDCCDERFSYLMYGSTLRDRTSGNISWIWTVFLFLNLKHAGTIFFKLYNNEVWAFLKSNRLFFWLKLILWKSTSGWKSVPPPIFWDGTESWWNIIDQYFQMSPPLVGTLFLKNVPPQSVPSNAMNRVVNP